MPPSPPPLMAPVGAPCALIHSPSATPLSSLPSACPCSCPCSCPGKSTVLRSIAAVGLLANCGLMVPAACATVPFYDALMLRNFSGDSPLEGKSSFQLEVSDMA